MLDWGRTGLAARAVEILRRHRDFWQALEEISIAAGQPVTGDALRNAFKRSNLDVPSAYLARTGYGSNPVESEESAPAAESAPADGMRERIIDAVRRAPVPVLELCDLLDTSPARLRAAVEQARAEGVLLHLEHEHVALRAAAREDERVQTPATLKPVTGDWKQVGVLSDIHFGSKWIRRDALADCVDYFYSQGVRDIIHPGDFVDGVYRFSLFEQSHVGLEAQVRDACESLPQRPGLSYSCITGNHDETFAASNGVDVGTYVEGYFRKHGRSDVQFYGRRSAYLNMHGAVIHLWHPGGGGSYALSYGLQKKCESYTAIKPSILLAGHWHFFCYVTRRGIHAVACPTFQGTGGRNGSEFGNSLKTGAPDIGGLLLRWRLTDDGTLRDFQINRRSYFEREEPVDIHNKMDAEPLPIPDHRAPRRS